MNLGRRIKSMRSQVGSSSVSILSDICNCSREGAFPLYEQAPAPVETGRPAMVDVFWYSALLLAVMIGAKVVHLQWNPRAAGLGYLLDLAVVTYRDGLLALLVGAAGALGAFVVRKHTLVRRCWLGAFAGVCIAMAIYALLSIFILAELRMPLTYRLLCLAGDWGSMRSSLTEYLTFSTVLGIVAGTAAYVAAARLAVRRFAVKRRTMALLAGAILVQAGVGHCVFAAGWKDRPDESLVRNPHWALLRSTIGEFFAAERYSISTHAIPAHLSDFQPPPPPAPLPLIHRPTNVIFFVLESVGTQFMSLYGAPCDTTPNLVREAEHSAVFDRFYAHVGVSATSLAAMTLSKYPALEWRPATRTRPDAPGMSIMEVLKPLGYRTLMVTSTDFAYADMSRFLEKRGFDQRIDCNDLGFPRISSWGTDDRHMVDRLIQWIDASPKQPFYAMTWTGQTHHPYSLSPEQAAVDFASPAGGGVPMTPELHRYLNALRESDAQLGRLFAALRSRGIENDTMVVITGDHGEAFGWPHDQTFHGQHLYEENVHVPCIIWAPGIFASQRRPMTVGGHIDINPTILHILGIAAPADWIGRSLLDDYRPSRTYFFAAGHDYLFGVREGDYKYIYNASTGGDQLFNVVLDPTEQKNLAPRERGRSDALRARLGAWTMSVK
jgi:arylsulfatase A-like enzyme